jgi:uncharacterized delta-60 repeat protein
MNKMGFVAALIVATLAQVAALCLVMSSASALASTQAQASLVSAEGSLDPTFGNGGIVTTTIAGAVVKLIWRGDGKIVAMGHGERVAYYYSVHGYQDYVVTRFNADGSLDDTFGNGGVTTPTPGLSLTVNSATTQPDGKVRLM